MSEKKCTKCKRTKLLGEFRAVSSMIKEKPGYAGDGYSDSCKVCVRKKSNETRAARTADKSGGVSLRKTRRRTVRRGCMSACSWASARTSTAPTS